MRTSAANRLGLDYATLAANHPTLVYCHVTGFSDDGPYAGRPAYDDIIQAASGLAMMQKVINGEPRYVPTIIADKISGVHAAYAIVLALMHRLRTGEGQQVDVSMFETMTAFNMLEHQWGHAFEPPIGPMGYEPVITAARRPYKTLDGHLALLPYSDPHWKRFFELAGEAQIMQDPRFSTFAGRQKNVSTVWGEIERQVARKTNAEWLQLLGAEDIPFSVVNSIEDLPNDPHLNAIDFWKIMEHPTEGSLRLPMNPIRMSASPPKITRLPPCLGEHSAEILRECDYEESAILQLLAQGGACAAV
jgi:crotonobetainyl-CoA:carnitine CoA-transferase CaiB-like acyl-CoA transferase